MTQGPTLWMYSLYDDRSNPHALLVLGVLATRNGDCDTATSVVKRSLCPPNLGGLSAGPKERSGQTAHHITPA